MVKDAAEDSTQTLQQITVKDKGQDGPPPTTQLMVKEGHDIDITADHCQGQRPGQPTANNAAHGQGRCRGQHADIAADHCQGQRPGWPTVKDKGQDGPPPTTQLMVKDTAKDITLTLQQITVKDKGQDGPQPMTQLTVKDRTSARSTMGLPCTGWRCA